MAAIPDVELLRAAQTGDEAALDELLARHEKQVFRFGLRMCGSEEDARDVLQETLVAAFQGLPNFRGDADISTWLYQIARSFCSKARRRRAGRHRQATGKRSQSLGHRFLPPKARRRANGRGGCGCR